MGLVPKRDMKKTAQPGSGDDGKPERPSRTQKKKAALDLQELGERLVKLTDHQLGQMELPEDILAAVKAAKAIKKHNPLSRQIQYIGSLMRKHDPAPIREFLDALDKGRGVSAKSLTTQKADADE